MIPRIFHTIWIGDSEIPHRCRNCLQRLKDLHPSYTFYMWHAIDVKDFMFTHFKEYYESFYNLPRKIMQIDMFRYFLMYKYGGFYIDLDYHVFKPFDELLNHKIILPCNKEDVFGNPTCISNCVIASEKYHPFWIDFLNTLNTIDRNNIDYKNDFFIESCDKGTGPVFLYSMWVRSEFKNDVYVPNKNLFHPQSIISTSNLNELFLYKNTFGLHYCTGLWRNNTL